MKKSSIWKLLFSALTVFAVAVFAGCTDDNDDMGAPYLNVTPENLTFDAEGQPADEYNGTFIVETNRPWRAIVEDEQTWVRLSATEGEGDAAVTVTVPASNIGQSAKVTFEVYNSYGALIQKDVNVLQGEVKPATVIYGNNFDKTLAAKDANNRWPFLDQSDAWQNATGTGIESVTYAYKNMSVRSSQKNSGGYDGASGQNKIFFGTAPANFDIDNITLPSGETNYRITFGANYSKNNDGTYDNTFKPEYFHVWVGNGTTWKELKYEKIGGSDETDPYWILFKSDFTLKTALKELSIRFTTTTGGEAANSAFSIDDLSFTNGNGGQEVDLEGGVVPPDPGEATAITIPELIAQMTTTEAPVDANADRYLDAVVMNDVAGANYTFNNLILATENATEAGNGITLYGSQVEPSTLGLNKGDKVRVTLYKGLAKVVNSSGMYEVTGAKEATWCKVEKTGTVTSIPTATIAAADLAKYQGMAVTIANASVAQAGVWASASASALSSHTFTADGANFTVFCKQSDEKNPSVFLDVPFKAGSGNISGLAAVYKNNSQLVPRNLDDVAAFSDSSTPMITGVTPASVSIPATGGDQVLTVSVLNQGDNQLSVSGLTPPLSATVDGLTVTVTAEANTGTSPVNQTLTITLAGSTKTVPVTLLGTGGEGSGTYTLIDNLSNLTAGTFLMAGFRAKGEAQSGSTTEPNPAAEDYYGVWTGEMITGNGKTDCETLQMTFANGELTKINVTNSPAEMELVAVDGKSNTYYIKCNGQYLASGSKSRSLSLGADPAEWVFSMVDKDGESRLVAANGGCSLQTVDSSFKTMIRGYQSATQGKHGIYFFKKN